MTSQSQAAAFVGGGTKANIIRSCLTAGVEQVTITGRTTLL
jgi:hypothetical protein